MIDDPLEIEISFVVKEDLESKLEFCGATLKKKVNFIDSYYDFEDTCFLALNDYWLRLRELEVEAKWELKYHAQNVSNMDRSNSLKQYYEATDEIQICKLLTELLRVNGRQFDSSFNDVGSLIKFLELNCFAKIATERLVYLHSDFEIDIDKADFGYKVGEIEYKSNGDGNLSVSEKIQRLNDFASKLGKLS